MSCCLTPLDAVRYIGGEIPGSVALADIGVDKLTR